MCNNIHDNYGMGEIADIELRYLFVTFSNMQFPLITKGSFSVHVTKAFEQVLKLVVVKT